MESKEKQLLNKLLKQEKERAYHIQMIIYLAIGFIQAICLMGGFIFAFVSVSYGITSENIVGALGIGLFAVVILWFGMQLETNFIEQRRQFKALQEELKNG